MEAVTLQQETYLPDDVTDERLAQVHDFLKAHEAAGRGLPEPRYFLAGASPGDQIEVPAEVHRVLTQVVEALRRGFAVTVAPSTKTLTTQQAADILGVSRPTVIKLLDEGRIPYERTGTHRRILLGDLLAYREKRRAAQYAALEATAIDIDDEEDLDETLIQLREIRRAVSERRRRNSKR
ncbi:excisionase family DNA binding protein [Actinomadura pelletieri DSM 43383]|uniref:Excisionase family DNA binding protein n=1 Tax=Actinomadura pelletieri DSM 43383 TaxID=1120940 RepID=A0A495QZP7_9ACTN|nr:helix-turn-helix domain-containing protein [Actinomadura pelletieri]RKS79695.1 excisionase family DNA binding protein [Actinomadura pelletieri DSM 43383]